jgi:hypothetical protein
MPESIRSQKTAVLGIMPYAPDRVKSPFTVMAEVGATHGANDRAT